jgi:hypothetical protein
MIIVDSQLDLSAIASALALPITDGTCTLYSFFGNNSIPNSSINWASQTNPLVVTGAPAMTQADTAPIPASAYFTVPAIAQDTLGSETILFVAHTNLTTVESAPLYVYGSAFGPTFNTGVNLSSGGNGQGGVNLKFGYVPSAGGTALLSAVVGQNNAAGYIAESVPQFWAATIDMTGMVVKLQPINPNAAWVGLSGVASGVSVAIPTGATRAVIPTVLPRIGSSSVAGTATTNNGKICFVAKFSRLLLSTEITTVYNQVKLTLSKRGITI